MKRSKKLFAILLATVLSTSVLAGCGSSSSESSTKSNKGNPEEIVYAYVTFNKLPGSSQLQTVEKAIDKITVPKINVKVKLKPLAISNYNQQVSLAMQSGEQLDVFHTLGDLNQYIAKNECAPLDDLISKYGKETKDSVGATFLKATQSNGKTYAVPANKGVALAPDLVYRSDIMKELGVDPSSIKSISDLDALFAKVKQKYPNMIPVAPTNQGYSGVLATADNIDYLTDDYMKPTAVLVGDSTKVQDYYETDVFKEKINIARDWYNKGYLSKDAATTTTLATELISADKCFSYIASYAGKESAAQISAQVNKPIAMTRLAQPYLSTTSVNAISWAIASTSKKQEAAMKFLNLTYSNKDVVNLLVYGIEGQDYVKTDKDHLKYPNGKDANSVPYTAALSCGIIGNQFNQYSLDGQSTADLKLMESENKNSAMSKVFGFTFDSSNVKTEYSAVMNVVNQYLPGLNCGSLNPNTELPNFIKKLKEAGMDTIVKEKQKQLDDWLSKNKK